jgi:addiction module HigA family antidote
MKSPTHIGGFVRRQIVEPLSLTVTDAAEALGVTRQALNNLLNEKASLTPEMAIRIEKAFGPKADHLMRMQLAYDMARARREQGTIKVRRIASRAMAEAGRERVRKQALSDLAAAREQRRAGGRAAATPTDARQPEIIAMVASGELTVGAAARLLRVGPGAISELVDQAEPSQPAATPRPRLPTGPR